MSGFQYAKELGGPPTDHLREDLQLAASTTVVIGSALRLVSGELAAVTATTSPDAISQEATASGSADIVKPKVIPVQHKKQLYSIGFSTPLLNDVAANSNSTTTQVVVALTDGSSDDLAGAVVYCPELDETRIVASNTYSSNVVTMVVGEAFSRAVTTGDTVRLVPWGPGMEAVRFDATTPMTAISMTRATATGGKIGIHSVDMKRKKALVYFID